MLTVDTLTALDNVIPLTAELLLIVKILKVVAPVTIASVTPAKVAVLVPAVNVPLLIKLL
jgi:hypothetical protein